VGLLPLPTCHEDAAIREQRLPGAEQVRLPGGLGGRGATAGEEVHDRGVTVRLRRRWLVLAGWVPVVPEQDAARAQQDRVHADHQ
jgi:hypothetical protein